MSRVKSTVECLSLAGGASGSKVRRIGRGRALGVLAVIQVAIVDDQPLFSEGLGRIV